MTTAPDSPFRRRTIAAIALALAALALLATAAPSSARPVTRSCGLFPGEGAFSYTKTQGVNCRSAIKTSYRIVRRFCDRPGKCDYGPHTPITRVYRGTVRYRGWRCRLREGYELSVVDCHRGKQHIFHKSGA